MKRFILGHGVAKAGTTWIWDYIKNGSNVKFPNRLTNEYQKEMKLWPNFTSIGVRKNKAYELLGLRLLPSLMSPRLIFDLALHWQLKRRFIRSDGEYYFTYCAHLLKNDGILADMTPAHAFLNKETCQRIMHSFEKGGISFRALYSMRDPVRRAVSHYSMVLESYGPAKYLLLDQLDPSLKNNVNEAFLAFMKWESQMEFANYKKTIDTLSAAYPEEQRMFVLFEEMIRGVKLRELSDFLGVSYRPEAIATSTNPRRALELDEEIAQECAQLYRPTYEAMAKMFPQTETLWSGWKYLR